MPPPPAAAPLRTIQQQNHDFTTRNRLIDAPTEADYLAQVEIEKAKCQSTVTAAGTGRRASLQLPSLANQRVEVLSTSCPNETFSEEPPLTGWRASAAAATMEKRRRRQQQQQQHQQQQVANGRTNAHIPNQRNYHSFGLQHQQYMSSRMELEPLQDRNSNLLVRGTPTYGLSPVGMANFDSNSNSNSHQKRRRGGIDVLVYAPGTGVSLVMRAPAAAPVALSPLHSPRSSMQFTYAYRVGRGGVETGGREDILANLLKNDPASAAHSRTDALPNRRRSTTINNNSNRRKYSIWDPEVDVDEDWI